MVRKNRRELLGGFFVEHIAKNREKQGFNFVLYSNIIKIHSIMNENLKLLNKNCMDL